ncbi:hypothetical protein T552_00691 [Pneumocystis carinii B80]|uniref:TLC domain-containing protein n=1 Tax=Pneumocystis carinii (strain B80) TaxID=1408658 RepID=A0A0W4ZPB2_PNEC8|nr:hypothetical protein T552_00691 [Pneumocystis carinii B80]KTW30213.1 hypothetical protein T552_00691 [Pneumocystis carinii B80]
MEKYPRIRDVNNKKLLYKGFGGFIRKNIGYFAIYQQRILIATIVVIIFIHMFITNSFTKKLFRLSYCDSVTQLCSKGKDDWYFVGFWVTLFTVMREFCITHIFVPFGRNHGIISTRNLNRFSEQTWSFIYYIIFWSFGMYISYNSPYWFNPKQLWIQYPQVILKPHIKWYYLVQFSFWIQQIFVVNIEKRRKDYYEMFFHHIITCTLIFMSYIYHFTQIGNAVLCIMDLSDIFLPLSKMLKYLKMHKTCNLSFFIFLLSWIITRHILFLFIVYSTYKDAGVIITHKWDPVNNIYFTKRIHMLFLALLIALEIILFFWLYLIIKVTWRVISGHNAKDTRSDSEDENDLALNKKKQKHH